MKKIIIAIILFSLPWVSSSSAYAHAQVTQAEPSRNQVIKFLPRLIWVEFDGDLMVLGEKNPNSISVTDSKNRRWDVGGSIVGGARLSVKLNPKIKAGKYKVTYRVVSDDGHVVNGSYWFTYSP